MNIASLFTGGVDKVVDSVANGLDKLFTSDEERLKAKNLLEQIKNEAKSKSDEITLEFEKEITKRWTSDNEHIITRLIRPISYAGVLVLFGAVIIADGNIGNFLVNPAYVPVLETLMTTMTIAYFGGRSIEKLKRT